MSNRDDTWKGWWDHFLGRLGTGREEDASPADTRQRRAAKTRNLVLMGLLGVGLILIGQRPDEAPVSTDVIPSEAVLAPSGAVRRDSIEEIERNLTGMLSQIRGAGRVEVMIVPKTSDVNVLAQEVTERRTRQTAGPAGRERETASWEESITRRPVILKNDASKKEEPLVEFVRFPEVAGVLVVADGASDARVRLTILRAVATTLDLPPHRVEVVAR